MSDLSPTPHLDDERLSALLDGEASPEDERHARACPECGENLAMWRQALSELEAPVPAVDAARREAAIDAALAAGSADLAVPLSGGTADPDGPVSLADHRRRRAGWLGPRIAAAVAAVVVIAGVAVGVSQVGGGGSDHPTAARRAPTTNPPGPPGQSASGAVPTSAGSSVALEAPVASLALGAFEDPGGLVAALQKELVQPESVVAAPPATPSAGTSGASPKASHCSTQAASDARLPATARPVLTGTLTYRGSPALVYVFERGRGHAAAVVSAAACRLLASASF